MAGALWLACKPSLGALLRVQTILSAGRKYLGRRGLPCWFATASTCPSQEVRGGSYETRFRFARGWEFALDVYGASDAVEETCCLGSVVVTSVKPRFPFHDLWRCRMPRATFAVGVSDRGGHWGRVNCIVVAECIVCVEMGCSELPPVVETTRNESPRSPTTT